jgi:hypothetical protein
MHTSVDNAHMMNERDMNIEGESESYGLQFLARIRSREFFFKRLRMTSDCCYLYARPLNSTTVTLITLDSQLTSYSIRIAPIRIL